MGEVDEWLERLGLGQYAAAFAEHDIDREILPDLTDQDLEKLGLSLGHRKKLLRAIAELGRRDGGAQREAEASPRAAERRQLTVLFCDLVGSTELAARLDPEDLREVIRAIRKACADVVGRFEGARRQVSGRRRARHFGWPQAHEDDAERAVRAGLQLVEGGRAARAPAEVSGLQARVGVATGQVVVGDLTGQDARKVDGERRDSQSGGAAAGAAEPGAVVISQRPGGLGRRVRLHDLGPVRLKGFAEPLAAFRVEGERPRRGALRGAPDRGPDAAGRARGGDCAPAAPLGQARDGEGQVVLLSGEPGIGKSRLLREVRARLEASPTSACSTSARPIIRPARCTP